MCTIGKGARLIKGPTRADKLGRRSRKILGFRGALLIFLLASLASPACTPILKEGGIVGLYHDVREGESLSGIADTYGVSIDDIMAANGLESTTIHPGQSIFIPRTRGGTVARTSGGTTTRTSDRSSTARSSVAESSDGFIWPLAGGKDRVVSGFGQRKDPIGGTAEFHKGIDIDGWTGERIYAAESGVIVYAGSKGGYGNMVMIDHGSGLVTVYAHLSSIVVRAGQRITKGNTLGYVGSSGYSTGSHLHFEVRANGTQVDPMPYLPN